MVNLFLPFIKRVSIRAFPKCGYYYYYYWTIPEFSQELVGGLHWRLSDKKDSQFSKIFFFLIPANLRNADIWVASILPQISRTLAFWLSLFGSLKLLESLLLLFAVLGKIW